MEMQVNAGPARGMVAITGDDNNDLAHYVKGLYITGAGDVKLTTIDNDTITVTVPANFILPIYVVKVFATGTTATGIFGFK